MTATDRGIDDIRHLPWEAKGPAKRQRKPLVPLITIWDLKEDSCRWPLNGNSPYHFCGEIKVPGCSYCVPHLRRSQKRGHADDR